LVDELEYGFRRASGGGHWRACLGNGLVNALMKDQKVWRALRHEMMRVVYKDINEGKTHPK
jgi:hypothetical protein